MPTVYPEDVKLEAIRLRKDGLTYREIQSSIGRKVPKNTFTGWFRDITLSEDAQTRILSINRQGNTQAREKAWIAIRNKRQLLLSDIKNKVSNEIISIDKLTGKLCLATLYLAEGGKNGEFVKFANSDPKIIELFINLLKTNFPIDETRLKGRLQCRVDQDMQELESYWSKLTGIPVAQFHKSWADPRTQGKPTLRPDYKGVFVVIYCSNAIFLELKFISDIIYHRVTNKGP